MSTGRVYYRRNYMQILLSIFNWIWEFIKIPLNLAEHLGLLKEVKEVLIAPSRYNAELEWARKMFDIKIQSLTEEKEKVAASDSEKKAIIEDLITKLRQARENSESLIEQNKKSIEERDVFRDAFKASDRMIKSLNQELEKYKLGKVPIYPSGDALQNALEAAFYENPAILGQKRQLGQRNNTNPFSIFLNPAKK